MIYRIHHDESYLMHSVPPVEAMTKLGEQYGTFAFNAEPKPYLAAWKSLHINFTSCTGGKAKTIPDISENFGRLFLSNKARSTLKDLLSAGGEFLSVTYEGGEGYLFNPLLTAEQYDAIDPKLTTHDQYGNLEHFGFTQENLKDVPIFKTKLDTYKGIFCSEEVKQACEEAALTGVTFHPDVSNPIGESYSSKQ
jgi:hypothetical protein